MTERRDADRHRDVWTDLYRFLEPDADKRVQPGHVDRLVLNVFRKLEWYFVAKGFAEADDLAQQTILRVAQKCGDVVDRYEGDRTAYFLGFARNVAREQWKAGRRTRAEEVAVVPEPDPWREKEALDQCLSKCLAELGAREPDGAARVSDGPHWIVDYYSGEGQARMRRRQELAHRLGRTLPTLRTVASRLRNWLEDCVTLCVGDMDWHGPHADTPPGQAT